jgi:hypothetical protein
MSHGDEWTNLIESLAIAEKAAVVDLIKCLRTPCQESLLADSTLVTPLFAAEFKNRLLTQHVFVGTPLLDVTFERAFVAAMEAAGFGLGEVSGATGRFWDFKLGGQRYSLKSSKAKNLSRSKAGISKLTEAAWIQDCRTATKRRAKTCELFENYLQNVERLIQLRYFEADSRYELVEIPVHLFRAVSDVPVSAFRPDGPAIGIPVGQDPPDFTLVLDRSDAKITLRNIQLAKCIVHGTWKVG